jgi:RHS repeat-associated protein
MTDRDGDMVQQYGYRPFGSENYHANTQAFSVSNRYTGQTLDEETGLYYYGARYYDPELARFIQADSTVPDPEFSQAYNRYAYCYNNPLKFSDPTGQEPLTIVALIAMAVKAALVSAYVSMGVAAMTGGDVGHAFITGLVGGFCGALGGVIGAVAGGAWGALITGGDPMQGALSAGVAAGVQVCLGFSPTPSGGDISTGQYLQELALSTASGAIGGGVTAEILGGNFGQGAAYGAAGAAAGYIVASALEGAPDEGDPQNDDPLPVSEFNPEARSYALSVGELSGGPVMSEHWIGYADALPHSTADEGIIAHESIVGNLKPPPGFWERLAGAGRSLTTVRHHSVPKAILKRLPKEVAENPLVRGVKGKPNIWKIPEDLHKVLHSGGPKGGIYNKFWDDGITAIYKSGRTPTVNDVLTIRRGAAMIFKLTEYAPK